ncbi:MAG TPA: aldo/keto reductase [Egibacteraceae bacterium]|jgi:aryl-alcohol dehydrogenase-like predicted oxidoreductase|nr:aldo/keto reductase [Egibacteraceae bacterium]
MQQTYLGRSGLVVSELCLGTMTFGGAADPDESAAIVKRFRDAGGTFFDTADVYTGGRSEEILGEILSGHRDQVVIATKAYGGTGPGPNDRSSSRRHLLAAVEASLSRLGTDWVDLYQLHSWDATTPLDETLSALDHLVRSGKVRYVGVSNFVGWQIERACRMQDARGYDRFVALQPQYSLVERQIEFETLPAAHANGLGILAWSPLAAGFLTGKYARGETADGKGRFAQFVDNIGERDWGTLEVVREVADARGSHPATVAVGWVLAQPATIPVIGATRADQIDASLAAAELRLGEDEIGRLTRVSEPARGYPWDFARMGGRPERELPVA